MDGRHNGHSDRVRSSNPVTLEAVELHRCENELRTSEKLKAPGGNHTSTPPNQGYPETPRSSDFILLVSKSATVLVFGNFFLIPMRVRQSKDWI